jgi:type II secretory pathway component PulM
MSLAGKILIGVIVVLTIAWLLLAAGVADYNREGSKALQKAKAETASLEAQLIEARAKRQALIDNIGNQQVLTGETLAVLETKRFAAQKLRADAIEHELRTRFELGDYQATLKNAESDRDHRIAEEKQTRAELEKLRADVRKLRAEDESLASQLARLRDEFKSLYRSNLSKVSLKSK